MMRINIALVREKEKDMDAKKRRGPTIYFPAFQRNDE